MAARHDVGTTLSEHDAERRREYEEEKSRTRQTAEEER